MNKHESKYFQTAIYMDEALLNLLTKKDYEFITVKELCIKAGVNRSTFYLHYETMDDLLEETVNMVNKKFMNQFSEISDISDIYSTILTNKKYLKPYLSFVKDNIKIYKLMHEKPNIFNLDKITKKIYDNVFNEALNNFSVKEDEKKYVFAFYTEGTLAIIKQWILGNCEDDIDFIIDLIEKNTFANK